MDIFKIKKNDTSPALGITLEYKNGSAIDLTGGSVFFNIGLNTYAPYFSGACNIINPTAGEIEYSWTGSIDTGSVGVFFGEFEIQWPGSKMTLPEDHSFQIQVFEDYN